MVLSSAASCPSSMNTPSSPGSAKSTSVVRKVADLIRSSPFSLIHARVAASSVPPRQQPTGRAPPPAAPLLPHPRRGRGQQRAAQAVADRVDLALAGGPRDRVERRQ